MSRCRSRSRHLGNPSKRRLRRRRRRRRRPPRGGCLEWSSTGRPRCNTFRKCRLLGNPRGNPRCCPMTEIAIAGLRALWSPSGLSRACGAKSSLAGVKCPWSLWNLRPLSRLSWRLRESLRGCFSRPFPDAVVRSAVGRIFAASGGCAKMSTYAEVFVKTTIGASVGRRDPERCHDYRT